MNTYCSKLGRILEERTPINKPGYYLICEDDNVRFSRERPVNTIIIDADRFIIALVESCRKVIRTFAEGPDNQDVYAFALSTDEYKGVHVYMNTISAYGQTFKDYQSKYPNYKENNSLKYNLGDFSFSFWPEEMGPAGEILTHFRNLSDYPSFVDEVTPLDVSDRPLIAFEAGIIEDGYYVLFLKAMQQLIAEDAFATLNRTNQFIAFSSIGDYSLDYSLIMRKTINLELFYNVFPDMQEKDKLFEEKVNKNVGMTAAQYLDYWLDAVQDGYSSVFPYTLFRSPYDIFLQMEYLGSALADEALQRLLLLTNRNDWTSEDYLLVNYYVEALYFAGILTSEHKQTCRLLALRFMEKHVNPIDDEFKDLAATLEAFAVQ